MKIKWEISILEEKTKVIPDLHFRDWDWDPSDNERIRCMVEDFINMGNATFKLLKNIK